MWNVINIIQCFLLCLWTGFCGLAGMVLLLLTWNPHFVMYFNGRYLWSPFMALVGGARIKAIGLENIDHSKNYIYVSNHESHFDTVAIARAVPVTLFYIAKKELQKIPFMGWFMTAIGMIFVDRGDKERAMASMREAGEKIKKGKNVISYPEGTRTKTDEVQIFKRGTFIIAKESQIGIVPMAIIGTRKILPTGSWHIRPGKVVVRIGKPIQPEMFAGKSIEEIATMVRNEVVKMKKEGMG